MEIKEHLQTGDEIEIEICPYGEYAAETVDGTPITEKFDINSLDKVVENWKADGEKEIRVDIDHKSLDGNTEATGWITKIWNDVVKKRLMGIMTVTGKGAELLNDLTYRFISPVFYFDEDNEHPYFLESAALTNTPRLKELRPVYNSDKINTENLVMNAVNVNTNTEDLKDMEKIKELLGMAEDATEEDILNTIKEMLEKIKAIEDAKAEEARIAEEKAVEAESEEIINECGIQKDEDKEVVKNSMKANKELTKSLLKIFPKQISVVNSTEAVKPELTTDEKLLKEYRSLKGGQEKVDFLMKHPGMKL